MNPSQAAVFHGAGRELELRTFAPVEPRGAEVLVRVLGCTLCGSDLHTFDGRRAVPMPTVLGHEIVGRIESFGTDAVHRDLAGRELNVGHRVTWSIVASCGECFYCSRGLPQKCLASIKYGHEQIRPGRELLGGLADYCLLAPGTALVRLPDDLPLEVACPASCATATVAAAIVAAGQVRDRTVCLFGMGLLGLTAAAMLRVQGAAQIVSVDPDPQRRARGLEFGATHAVAPDELAGTAETTTNRHGFDTVLELSGSCAAFETGWPLLRRGGTLVLVGAVFPTPPIAISPEDIVRRNLTIHGVHNYPPAALLDGVEFLSANYQKFPFADLVSDWLPLASADQAFQLSRDPSRIRVGVRPTD